MQRKWKRRWQRLTKALLPPLAAGLLFFSSYNTAWANPTGGTVVSGSAAITASGATTTVNQTTDKAIVNWQSFSIAKGETVNFIQPSASAVALNRVIGTDASSIYGTLTANGKVFLINPNGILFAPGSQVSTGGLVASTLDIKDSDFLSGQYTFSGSGSGSGSGSVTNQGTITATNEAVLLGPQVTNTGAIAAKVTALGAGQAVSLDFSGDSLLNLTVDTGAAGGSATNSGTITASGGLVVMTAGTKDALLNTVVNNSGVIRAQSVNNVNGVIRLEGGTVVNSGTLDASGKTSGQTGGTIKLLGDTVTVQTGSILDVSGDAGGGTALIGGAYQGGSSEYQATNTTVEQGAAITADAITSGNGGQIVVWAKDTTQFAGAISAQGGSLSGDGGSVETSGKQSLKVADTASVNTTADKGKTGSWLLDPADFTIADTGGDMTGTALQAALANNDVTITTGSSGSTVTGVSGTTTGELNSGTSGDLTVNSDLTWTSTNTLTLSAYNNINLNSSITATSGGLTLAANTSGSGNGTTTGVITPANGSSISVGTFILQSGTWREITASLSSFTATDFRLSGGTFLRALAGDGTSSSPYEISDVYGLQGIGSSGMLGKYYTLANDIDASGTASWNSGAGFVAIGTSSTAFTGSFDGQCHTISSLTIYRPFTNYVGLFGYTGSGSIIRNVGLTDGSVTGFSFVGGLVGVNNGSIANAYNSGSVSSSGGGVGGLVGENNGSITNAYNSGSVSGGGVGGLVGYNYGSITNSYNSGSVSGSYYVGGLVGSNDGFITSSYWDVDTSGQKNGIGDDTNNQSTNVTGLYSSTTKSAFASTSYNGWDIATTGGSTSVWRIYDGYTYPLLRSFLTAVTVTSATTTYNGSVNGTASSYTLSDSNATSGVSGSLSYTTGSKNAGTYSTANTTGNTLTLNGLYSTQQGYDISYDGTLTITPATLTITAVSDTKTYDGTTVSSGTVTYSGLQTGDSVNNLTQSFDSKNVLGTDASILRVNSGYTLADGNNGGNYTVTTVTAAGTITPATLTITAASDTKTYDGTTVSSGTVTYSGLQTGDSVNNLTQSFDSKNVLGTDDSTLSVDTGYTLADGNNGNNYTVTTVTAAGTITPATLTVTANDASKTLDGRAYSGGSGVTYSGFVNGEDSSALSGSLTYGGTAQGAINAGTYTISASSLSSGNYTISYVNGTLTITGRMADPTYDGAVLHAEHLAGAMPGGAAFSGLSGYLTGSANLYAPLTIIGSGINIGGYPLTVLTPADPANSVSSAGGETP